MEPLSAESISRGLDTGYVGHNLVFSATAGSTNSIARRLAREGAPEGTLVITEYQSAGRGRLDRRWQAPPGTSLLLSLLFRPDLAPHQVQRLTMICGLATVDAIEAETGLPVGLKWPNDLVYGGAKLGGILTEIELAGSRVDSVVVGIGLNVNLEPDQLSGPLMMSATSLAREIGAPVARLPLLLALLSAVEARYGAVVAGHSPHHEWAAKLTTIGQPVAVHSADSELHGIAESVDADGGLRVRLPDGSLQTVLAADVSLRSRGASARA
jgi:BirA family biotin operon repressor/biotin-[acetyl-CoA-carboxylase] ligase